MGQPFDLSPNSPPMRVVYKDGSGTLRGTVVGAVAASIVVAPDKGASDPSIVSIDAAADAPFQIEGLAPAGYYIAAFDHIEPERLLEPAILQRVLTLGSRVKIEEGSNASVELRVNRWQQ